MARPNTRRSTTPPSRLQTATPEPHASQDSDQENRDPATAATRREREKSSRRSALGMSATSPPTTSHNSLPTPTSNGGGSSGSSSSGADGSRGQKRKRGVGSAMSARRRGNTDEERFNKYFDPNQDPELRRDVKKQSRLLDREFHENRDDLLRDGGEGLASIVTRANDTFEHVKQTADATLDSRLLVNVSDLGYRKSAQLVLGDSSTGVDVDEFLSKCITYMRNAGPLDAEAEASTQQHQQQRRRRRARHNDDDDSDDEHDDAESGSQQELDWEILGRHACFPYNARPPCPSFLLGPLSVEKKARTQTQRRGRQQKDSSGREARPEDIGRNDLQQEDENTLTNICTRIRQHLQRHSDTAQRMIQQSGVRSADELISTERGRRLLKKARIADTGYPSLFEYVVNPHSFGQTVENLFYVSFLIKEGAVGIENDSNGLPTLVSTQARTVEQQRKEKTSKHQAVFGLDYATWQKLVEAFDIKEPMIPHRNEEQANVGARGWYNG